MSPFYGIFQMRNFDTDILRLIGDQDICDPISFNYIHILLHNPHQKLLQLPDLLLNPQR